MVLHLPHLEGGFDVTFNTITKDPESSVVMSLVIMLAPALSIPEPKRLTIGQSSNLLTYFAQHIG